MEVEVVEVEVEVEVEVDGEEARFSSCELSPLISRIFCIIGCKRWLSL